MVLNQVAETSATGKKPNPVRSDTQELYVCSSNPRDAKAVIDAFRKGADNLEVIQFYGTGEEGMSNLEEFIEDRKNSRSEAKKESIEKKRSPQNRRY